MKIYSTTSGYDVVTNDSRLFAVCKTLRKSTYVGRINPEIFKPSGRLMKSVSHQLIFIINNLINKK